MRTKEALLTISSIKVHVHVVTKEIILLGMFLLKYIPCKVVDCITACLSKLIYRDLSSYGLRRPIKGPFLS